MNKDDWMRTATFAHLYGNLHAPVRGLHQPIFSIDDAGFYPVASSVTDKTWFFHNTRADMGITGMPLFRMPIELDARSIEARFDALISSCRVVDVKTRNPHFESLWHWEPGSLRAKRLEAYAATQWEDRTLLHAKAYSFEFDGRSIIDSYTQSYYYDTLKDQYVRPFPVDSASIRAQLQDVRAGRPPRMYGPKALALLKTIDWKRVGRTKSGWGSHHLGYLTTCAYPTFAKPTMKA